jgi:hypothetical protein
VITMKLGCFPSLWGKSNSKKSKILPDEATSPSPCASTRGSFDCAELKKIAELFAELALFSTIKENYALSRAFDQLYIIAVSKQPSYEDLHMSVLFLTYCASTGSALIEFNTFQCSSGLVLSTQDNLVSLAADLNRVVSGFQEELIELGNKQDQKSMYLLRHFSSIKHYSPDSIMELIERVCGLNLTVGLQHSASAVV